MAILRPEIYKFSNGRDDKVYPGFTPKYRAKIDIIESKTILMHFLILGTFPELKQG